jgi:hypothetical protein
MRNLPILAVAVSAGLLAGHAQAAPPAGASVASACGGLGFAGGGQAIDEAQTLTSGAASCSHQTSAVGGSASASGASSGISGGVPFSNSATSSAGPKALHLDATNNGAFQAAFPAGLAQGGFSDEMNLTAAGQSGEAVWIVPIKVIGTLDANGLGANGLLSLAAYENNVSITAALNNSNASLAAWAIFNTLNDPLYRGSPSGSGWDFENVEWRADDRGPADPQTLHHLDVNDTIFFAIPFTWGQDFDLGIYGQALAGEGSSGAGTDPNTTTLAFQDTISWGGPGYVITGGGTGPILTDFTIGSLTGTDYSTPFSEGVPEPSEWTLLVAGLFGLGVVRRRRPAGGRA